MRYPKFLKKGGTVGFVAPSFGCVGDPYESAFNNALKNIESMGYKTWVGENCRKAEGIGKSSTPESCGKELSSAYMADNNDVLISCGGGELMCEDIPYIDFEGIKKSEPKWFMGYSDNTNFTYLSATITDTAAIYGPCAGTFGQRKWHKAVDDAWKLLSGEKFEFTGYDGWESKSLKDTDPLSSYNITEKESLFYEPKSDKEKGVKMHGRLIGGCLDCLTNLVGTKFDKTKEFVEKYKKDGIIWFLEACDLNVMSISRSLWTLMEAGWFEGASGFIFGRPYHFDEPLMNLDRHGAVRRVLHDSGVPIVMDVDLGHLPPAIPVITGAMATIEAKGDDFKISYELK